MITLQTASEEFLSHCRFEKNLSSKTIKAYRTDLLQLQNFFTGTALPQEIAAITKYHLREYLVSLTAMKPKSIKRKIAVVKAFFNYLEFEDRITVNPLRKMRINIREPHRLPTVMDITEVRKIFSSGYKLRELATDKESYSYFEALRNIVVIELLFSTGARVSEIAGLQKESINLVSGSITIKGKGNKERIIQVCNKESLDVLRTYYSLFRNKIEQAGGSFLINRFCNKLSDQSIRNMVKSIASKAGIKKHITPHIFRHSFATLLLEKDVDIKYIQAMLGHSSIMTTQLYTHVNKARQRHILKTRHPRKDFTMVVGE